MASLRVTCPNCGARPTINDRAACPTCGAYLIHGRGMPIVRPVGRVYKRDADGTWRLVQQAGG